jgi:hypothetical protein
MNRYAAHVLEDLSNPEILAQALKSDAYRVKALIQGAVAAIPKGGRTVPQDQRMLGQAQHILNVMDGKEQGKINVQQLAGIIKAFMTGAKGPQRGTEPAIGGRSNRK